jgi:hypothetical protein
MVLKNIEDAIKARWPEAVVQSFGSFPSNLSTFLSDVDITILGLAGYPVPEMSAPMINSKRNLDATTPTIAESKKRQKTSPVDAEEREPQIAAKIIQEAAPEVVTQEEEQEQEVSWFIDRGDDVVFLDRPNQQQAIIDLVTPPGSPAQESDSDTQPIPVFASEEEEDDDDDMDDGFEEEEEDSSSGGSLEGEEDDYSDYDSQSDESSDGSLSDMDESEPGDFDIHIDGAPSSSSAAPFHRRAHHTLSSPHQNRQNLSPSPANRQEENQILATLSQYLRSLDYTRALEFRSKARVPIINLIHKGDIECDISIGLSNQKTNNLIQLLSYQHNTISPQQGQGRCSSSSSSSSSQFTKIFFEISCFLKIFFHQFYLDLPYTGGLGSYKIYGMITFIINKIHEEQSKTSSKKSGVPGATGDLTLDSGYILIYFFKYFGNKQNLNLRTVLRIQNQNSRGRTSQQQEGGGKQEGAEEKEEEDILVEFSKTSQVTFCQQLCSRAYCILYLIITKGIQHLSTIASSPTSSSSLRSHSTLSVLISRCDQFVQNRMLSSKLCRIECPLLLDCDKDNMGKIILKEMKEVLNSAIDQQVTPEDIQRFNPLLWERMRCYGRIPILRGQGGGNGGTFVRGMDGGKGRASFPLTRKGQGFGGGEAIPQKKFKPRRGREHELNEALLDAELAEQRERRNRKKKIKRNSSEKRQQQHGRRKSHGGQQQGNPQEHVPPQKKVLAYLKKGKIRGNKKKNVRRKTL